MLSRSAKSHLFLQQTMSNTTGSISGAGTVHSSGALEFTLDS